MINTSDNNSTRDALLVLPSLGFADEQSEYLVDLLEQKSEMSEEYTAPNARTKEGSQAIQGEWQLSYNFNGSHKDKIVLNKTETSDKGMVYASGNYYPNQAGAGSRVVCFDFSNATYNCLSEANSTFVVFKFKIQENSINSGFFGSGSTVENAFDVADSSQYPLTGNRGGTGTGSTTPGGTCTDPFSTTCNTTGGNTELPIYNDAQQQIEIPVLNYNGKKYRLILKNEGNSMFKLIEVPFNRSINLLLAPCV